ncbi:amidohydrolase family protein [Patescibacteria group bacterium]
MIIDIHAHTSNSKMWGLHTEVAHIKKIEEYARQYGIAKVILMATYFPFKGTGLFNQKLLERIERNPLFGCFVSLDAMNNMLEGVKEVANLLSHPQVLGIKLYAGYQKFNIMNPELFPLFEIAGEKRIPVAIHTGELHHCCPKKVRAEKIKLKCGGKCKIDELQHFSHPDNFTEIAKKFPKVNFILSHLSNPYFQEIRNLMTICPNVYTDISGQFVSGADEDSREYREFIQCEIKKFLKIPDGINRIMFGTDFPIQSYKDSIEIIESLNFSQEEKESLYFRNAQKILNLQRN